MNNRIIDVHNHPSWHGHSMDKIVRNMDEMGIAKTWLLACESSPTEMDVAPHYYAKMDPRGCGLPLWMVVEALQRHPDRFIGGWAPDPRERHARARLQAAVEIHNIRVYGEMKFRMRYDNQDALAMYTLCAELGLPVLFHLEAPPYRLQQQVADIHAWPEWYGGGIEVVETICRSCAQTAFIGHGPGFWREISGNASTSPKVYPDGPVLPDGPVTRLMRAFPNLYADLSGGSGLNALSRDRQHALGFLTEFQDRLLFGRDGFDARLAEFLTSLELAPGILDKVLHANAERLIPETP
jgi:predicted TIM-barrel fold metal-dependent hydrolase